MTLHQVNLLEITRKSSNLGQHIPWLNNTDILFQEITKNWNTPYGIEVIIYTAQILDSKERSRKKLPYFNSVS